MICWFLFSAGQEWGTSSKNSPARSRKLYPDIEMLRWLGFLKKSVPDNNFSEQELFKEEDPHYGLVDNGGDYETVFGCSNAYPGLLALRLQSNHYNFHGGAGSDLTFA